MSIYMGNVRQALNEDVDSLVALGLKFHRLADHPGRVAYCNRSAEATLRGMMADPASLLLVNTTAGEVDGMIGVRLAPVPYNLQAVWAQETFWWAEGGSGIRLLRAAMCWAKAQDAKAFMLSSLVAETEATLLRVLKRMGFCKVETCMGVAL
jgi:hypothetical protein